MKKLKIGITGHTSGLGLAIYNHFSKDHEVLGFSRSNGYELPNSIQSVAEIVQTFDIFFNNTHAGIAQSKFIQLLAGKTCIVTSGSMASDDRSMKEYPRNKFAAETLHRKYRYASLKPMLLLKMGYLENYTQIPSIPYQQILNALDFWIQNPRASVIEFDNIQNDQTTFFN